MHETISHAPMSDKKKLFLGDERRQLSAAAESTALLMSQAVKEKYYRNGNPAGIYIGLRMAFPELVGDPRTEKGKERLDELYVMVDYINAYNSVVDDAEGMRRILQSNPDTKNKVFLEAAIDGVESHWHQKRTEALSLFEKHGRKQEAQTIMDIFEADLRALVVAGNQDIASYTPEDCIQRREYDNAIFELTCAATMYGVDKFETQYADSTTTIEQRYGWMLDKSIPSNSIHHWLKALHKTYVAVGIFDDFQGITDDLKLGLITYPAYLKKIKGLSTNEIRADVEKIAVSYDKQAQELGVSTVIRKTLRKFLPLFDNFISRKRKVWEAQELSVEELRKGGVVYIRERLSLRGLLD